MKYDYSPEKWLYNEICYPSNRSKQIQETHMAYSAGTQYTRQSLNEHNIHGFTGNRLFSVKSCMLFFIQTLPRILCAGDISRVGFLDLFGPIAGVLSKCKKSEKTSECQFTRKRVKATQKKLLSTRKREKREKKVRFFTRKRVKKEWKWTRVNTTQKCIVLRLNL